MKSTTKNNYQALIEQVGGIEKAREIVSGAPTQDCFYDTYEGLYYSKDHDHYWEWWDSDCEEWFECEFVVNQNEDGFFNLNTLRTAIAEYDSQEFKVGDLVDRGIQNIECVGLIDQPWFTSVKGNHEDLCIWGRCDYPSERCHRANGGEWFYELSVQDQYQIAKKFSALPIALEVNHGGKKYGFVHGHIEQNSWEQFKETLTNPFAKKIDGRSPAQLAMWGRDRINTDNLQYTHVAEVDAVIMGHTVTQKPFKRDNCYYIDTGAVHWGTITILDLSKV